MKTLEILYKLSSLCNGCYPKSRILWYNAFNPIYKGACQAMDSTIFPAFTAILRSG